MEESNSTTVTFHRYQTDSDSSDDSRSNSSNNEKKNKKNKSKHKHDSKKKSKKKKDKDKKKKHKHKHKHKHKRKDKDKDKRLDLGPQSPLAATSIETVDQDDASKSKSESHVKVIQASIDARKSAGLDWMCLPPPPAAAPSIERNEKPKTQQTVEQRIQSEVVAGKRESSSKLPYGLFDPKRQKLNDELLSCPHIESQANEETDEFGRVKMHQDIKQTAQAPKPTDQEQEQEPETKKLSAAEEMRLLLEGNKHTIVSERTNGNGDFQISDASVTTKKLNKLVAQGMRAQLTGDQEKYKRITERISALKKAMRESESSSSNKTESSNDAVTVIAPFDERGRMLGTLVEGRVPATLEREDVRSRRKRGILFHESRVDSEGNVDAHFAADLKEKGSTVKDMLAQEKMSRRDGLDETYLRNVMKQGSRFKDTSLQRQIGRETEDVDISLYESKTGKMTARRLEELERKRAVTAHKLLTKAELSCPFSFRNPNFRKDLVVAVGEYVYAMLPHSSIAPGHCRIIPIESVPAFTAAEDEVWEEVNKFKGILETKAAAEEKTMVYMETVMDTNRLGWHTSIECIPVEESTAELVPMYFKKGLLESDSEWSTHRKVIDTSEKGLRRSIPQGFPYFHVAWAGGGYKPGGYAHVVENPEEFPVTFGMDVLCGAMGQDPSRFNRRGKINNVQGQKEQVDSFKQAWEAAKSKQN